jgi:hypothetical protein|tara:strand:+ start:4158 stop:4412 length:255 start_codon:yes stop_codon:yes gene_type:complete
MSGNLAEFIKVFLIVFSFSGGILMFRRFMLNIDDEDTNTAPVKEDNLVNLPKKTIVERKTLAHPDIIDYDGMGNQGRFPKTSKK